MHDDPVDRSDDVDGRLDGHLAAVAEVIDTIHFHNESTPDDIAVPLTLAEVWVEALDAWVCQIAVEHHQSRQFTTAVSPDRHLAVFGEFVAALVYLRARGDTSTSFISAWDDALEIWLIEHRPDIDAMVSI